MTSGGRGDVVAAGGRQVAHRDDDRLAGRAHLLDLARHDVRREGRAARAVHAQDDGGDGGVAAALLQRRDQRVRAGEGAHPEGQLGVGAVDHRAVDEQHGDAAARPGRRRARATNRDRAAARLAAPSACWTNGSSSPSAVDGVDQAGQRGVARREDAAVDERADDRRVHRVTGAGAVGGDGRGHPAVDVVEQLVLVLAHRRRLLRHHERLHRALERADAHQVQVDADAVHGRPCRT